MGRMGPGSRRLRGASGMTDLRGGLSRMTMGRAALYDQTRQRKRQSQMSRPPAKPTVQVDNDRVLVTEWRFAPGAETTWFRHGYDYGVVPLTTGKLQIDDGKTQRYVALTAGKSY